MAYNRGERPDSPMKRRGGAEEKKFVYSVVKRITRSTTRM